MSMIEKVYEKARQYPRRIVFPEGDEKRTLLAAEKLKKDGLCIPVLVGNAEKIRAAAAEAGADIAGIAIVDPETDGRRPFYIESLYELRKAKGLTMEQADRLASDPMYWGILMVKLGDGDGLVSAADAAMILRYDMGLIDLSDAQLKAADMDGDGEVTDMDARALLRYVAGRLAR